MGGNGAGRDLERMFDLELDTTKNQYETGESASSASAQQKAMDDALQRSGNAGQKTTGTRGATATNNRRLSSAGKKSS